MARPGARIGADRAAGKGAFRRKLVRARRWLVLLMRCFAPLLFVAAVGGALPACSTDEASSRCPEPATVSLASLQEAIERAPRGSQCRKDLLRLLDAMSAGEEGTKSEGVLKSVLDLRRIGSQLEEMEAIARQSTEEPDALQKNASNARRPSFSILATGAMNTVQRARACANRISPLNSPSALERCSAR